MEVIKLYKYERGKGKFTVSPVKPECEYVEMFRLVANEGKILVKDGVETTCIDTYTVEGWTEIDAPEEIETIK